MAAGARSRGAGRPPRQCQYFFQPINEAMTKGWDTTDDIAIVNLDGTGWQNVTGPDDASEAAPVWK